MAPTEEEFALEWWPVRKERTRERTPNEQAAHLD